MAEEDWDDGISASEDEDAEDERKHVQLIDAIASLDGKKKQKAGQRTVHSAQISEFHFGSSTSGGKVHLHELMGSLKKSASHGEVKKQLRSVQKKNQVVSVPLAKHEKEKIERSVAYERTKEDVSKWDPVVKQNRQEDQIVYPLEKQDLRLITTDQFVKRFQPRTPLEMQVAALLGGSDNVPQPDKMLTKAEERALQAMSVQEAKERRQELMKHRALLSYQESKARWRKKIKSKNFHRQLKKDRQKTEKKALENMQQTDPEGFAEKMKELEKTRMEERMSLKHRGGSKYSQKQMIYAKYDDKAREEVQDMLQKSREMTRKVAVETDSEDEAVGTLPVENIVKEGGKMGGRASSALSKNPWLATPGSTKNPKAVVNPWMDSSDPSEQNQYSRPAAVVNTEVQKPDIKTADSIPVTTEQRGQTADSEDEGMGELEIAEEKTDEIDDIFNTVTKKTKISETKNESTSNTKKSKKKKKQKGALGKSNKSVEKANKKKTGETDKRGNSSSRSDSAVDVEEEEDGESMLTESLSRKRTLEEVANISDYSSDDAEPVKKLRPPVKPAKQDKAEEAFVDPKKLFTMDTKIRPTGKGADIVVGDSDDDENDDDEDVDNAEEEQRMTIAQAFADDDVIEEFRREKEEAIESEKPKDIDLTLPGWGSWGGTGIKPSKKKKRFIIKAEPGKRRSDMHLGHVIINEKADKQLSKHQVKQLPFPYLNVKQFEQSIKAPIGTTWNPESAFKELTKPKVVTKLGTVIDPINKAETFKDQRASEQNPDIAVTEKEKKTDHKNKKGRKRKQKK